MWVDDRGGSRLESTEGMCVVVLLKTHIQLLEIHCDWPKSAEPVSAEDNVTTPHVYGKHVGFQLIIPHLKFDIFTTAFTFHCASVYNLNLEVRNCSYKAMHRFCDFLVDEIMCTSTINQNHYWAMFNKPSDFERLRGRNPCQGMQRNNWFVRDIGLLVIVL